LQIKSTNKLHHGEYFDALSLIDSALDELRKLPRDADLKAIKEIHK
jgi:hypothetical protein